MAPLSSEARSIALFRNYQQFISEGHRPEVDRLAIDNLAPLEELSQDDLVIEERIWREVITHGLHPEFLGDNIPLTTKELVLLILTEVNFVIADIQSEIRTNATMFANPEGGNQKQYQKLVTGKATFEVCREALQTIAEVLQPIPDYQISMKQRELINAFLSEMEKFADQLPESLKS